MFIVRFVPVERVFRVGFSLQKRWDTYLDVLLTFLAGSQVPARYPRDAMRRYEMEEI